MESKIFTPYTPKQENNTKIPSMSPIISQQDIHLESLTFQMLSPTISLSC